MPVWVAKESTRFQYAETFSAVTTEAIRCYSCVSGIGGSGCEDEFDESGGGVTIIENDESTTDPCTACTKLKASAYGNMFSSSSEISFLRVLFVQFIRLFEKQNNNNDNIRKFIMIS